ncbi:MAG: hypothetical protein WKG00_10195 [Polyangiaceae bacterium]
MRRPHAAAAAEVPSQREPPRPMSQLWSIRSIEHSFNSHVELAPWGDAIVLDQHNFRVHARDTGQLLDRAPLAHQPVRGRPLHFIGEDRVAVVTEAALWILTFPELLSVPALFFDGTPRAASWGTKRVAVTFGAGRAKALGVYELESMDKLATWSEVIRAPLPEDAELVALSPDDERLAIATSDGVRLTRISALGKALPEVTPIVAAPVLAMAFSPRGSRLAVASEPGRGSAEVSVALLDMRTEPPKALGGIPVRGRLLSFLSEESLAIVPSRGLVIGGASSPPQVLAIAGQIQEGEADGKHSTGQGQVQSVGAAPDGSMVCVTHSDALACFASAPPRPSTYRPDAAAAERLARSDREIAKIAADLRRFADITASAKARAASDAAAASASPRPGADGDARPVDGEITARQGATLRVKLSGAAPAVGARGRLLGTLGEDTKRIAGSIFGGALVGGWVTIAQVEVTKVDRDQAALTILKEESVVMKNGKKVDHFKIGEKVRLETK